jgi:excisionase family DNA binding protein
MPQAQDACGRQANHAEGRQPEESRSKREAQTPVAETKDELEPDMNKPYSAKTLAERWDCSEAQIRSMVRTGKLAAFTLGGKLIRIPAEEVDKWEMCLNSSGTGENSPSASLSTEHDTAAALGPMTSPPRGNAWRITSKPKTATARR